MDNKDILIKNIPFVDVEKPIKAWGSAGEMLATTGATVVTQVPSDEELKAAKLQRSGESTSYTFTTPNYNEVISSFNTYAEYGQPAYDITATEGNGGIWTVVVQKTTQVRIIEGREHEDDVDYGSDGEGNINYDDWTTKRKSKIVDERWFLEWDDVKNWPPFAKYGKQWIDPWTLKAYKLLVDGGHFEGDLVTMAIKGVDYTMPINMFEQETIPDGMSDDEAAVFLQQLNPPGTAKEAYYTLLKGQLLILVHTWSKQWVISKYRFKTEYDDMTEEEKEEYDNKGILITTQVRGNEDGKETKEMDEHGVPITESNTYTVTRTWTDRKIWDKSMVNKLPIGMKLKEPAKNPEP